MTALKVLKTSDELYEELSLSPSVLGKRVSFLYNYLSSYGITSLSEINVDILRNYIYLVHREFALSKGQIFAFKGDLETVTFAYMKKTNHPLTNTSFAVSARGRKALVFLYASGIDSFSGITADTRISYERYIALSVPAKATEYLKQLDKMMLSEIANIAFVTKPRFENKLFYIGYYPDPYIAERLYYTARKEFLYFDFSLPAPACMKKQIFRILLHDLSRIRDIKNHYLLQHFIIPLYYLYKFCVAHGISDIKQVTDDDVSVFLTYLDENMTAKSKTAPQALFRARKYLFLSDEKIDFTATLWSLDRFDLSGRKNDTRSIENFEFGDIKKDDRIYLQHFMEYLLILSPKYSLQSLLEKYNSAKDFIRFLEKKNSSLSEISYSDIEEYISLRDSMDIKPFTYNLTLTMLSFFLTVLSVREDLLIPSFPFEYFYKKADYLHHDRSVEDDTIDRIMTVLPDFPETIGLIYITLYSTGLRINEVCSLKKDALFKNGGSDWLMVYQRKLRAEKNIPVPEEIARLLRKHISEDDTDSEFIFPSCKDPAKPFQVTTFVKQMKKQLLLYEETKDICFKSHDYRHTIATDLYMSGASLGATRAFLGHAYDDMTKQYIDHLPGRIDKRQDEYFKENDLYETDV